MAEPERFLAQHKTSKINPPYTTNAYVFLLPSQIPHNSTKTLPTQASSIEAPGRM
jgi:hypothetical protein